MQKNRPVILSILCIILVCFFLCRHFSWNGLDGKGYTRVIESDGKGYYMYLPAIFIHKNIEHQNVDDRFIFKTQNGAVNKYYVGTAVCMLPFFASAYLTTSFSNQATDGYSSPFQKAISFSGLFYLGLGLLFLSKLLQLYQIRSMVICICLFTITFGTNLMMYAVYHPSFSHIYSFCFITLFLFYSKKTSLHFNLKHVILMSVSLAMIVIIRPPNAIVVLLLPFIYGSFYSFQPFLKNILKPKTLFYSAIVFIAILGIQLYVWYLQTGELIVWTYKNEGFYFLHPEIFNVLFSYRKGFFIYTPLAFITLAALIPLYKKNKFQALSILIFMFVLIYITASWWCWYYGPSYGQRSFIDFYALTALLLAFLVNAFVKQRQKKWIYVLLVVICTFNLLQSYQYAKGILSSWNMNEEKYKYVFLRTSSEYYSCLGGCRDMKPYASSEVILYENKNDFEKKYDNWNDGIRLLSDAEHKVVANFSKNEFNSGLELIVDSKIKDQRLLYAEIELDRMETIPSGKNSAMLVVSLSNEKNESYSYYSFPLSEIPNQQANRWRTFHYSVEIPKAQSPGDHLKIYVWNQHLQSFYIDNFKVKLLGLN